MLNTYTMQNSQTIDDDEVIYLYLKNNYNCKCNCTFNFVKKLNLKFKRGTNASMFLIKMNFYYINFH